MTAWLGAVLLVLGVLALCKVLGVVSRSRTAIALAQESFGVISDRGLADEQKEQLLQKNALRLFKLFAILLLAGAAAFSIPLALLWGADRLGALSWDEVLTTTLSWPFLTGTLIATTVGFVLMHRRRGAVSAETGFENRYSAADRWLHQVAFASTPAQVTLAGVEDRFYRRRLQKVSGERPVFITALPRAGTTLLLNACAGLDEFVTHTYRQMPFVLTPVLWEKFSRRFRVKDAPRERAHGDGMLVSVDSPEALEEMLWLHFWPEHYRADRIMPWTPDEKEPAFVDFFRRHMQKLAMIGRPGGLDRAHRYVSKNNGNIARIAWLARAFPDARFIVPFRPPLQHAASLRRQHLNFLEIHRRDPFARHYMAGIGHFDFGANLRPIDFGGWLAAAGSLSATELEFWVRYWIAAYRDVIACLGSFGEQVRLVDFDVLCRNPAMALASLGRFLGLEAQEHFLAQAAAIHQPRKHPAADEDVSPAVMSEAQELYAQLVTEAGRAAEVHPHT
jgi:hypothetical protein